MLVNFENGKEIKEVWHKKEYDVFLNKINALDKDTIESIKYSIKNLMSTSEVNVTSWMPGKDWTGTPYQPIFDALGLESSSAMCFGLLVQECIIEDDRVWSFTRIDKIEGMVYFEIKNYLKL